MTEKQLQIRLKQLNARIESRQAELATLKAQRTEVKGQLAEVRPGAKAAKAKGAVDGVRRQPGKVRLSDLTGKG